MRKLIGAIVLGIATNSFAFSQDASEDNLKRPRHHQMGMRDTSPEERVERVVRRLTAKLDLTESQQAELKAFQLEQMKAGKAQMENAESWEERHEVRKAHWGKMNEKMESLLSDAQMLKYEQMKENRKQKRGEKKRHRKGSRP